MRFVISVLSMAVGVALQLCAPALVPAQEKGIGDFPKLSAENDWPWWRGPSRKGIAADTPVPTKLSDTDNVVWKTPVPFRGHSSPTVVGNRIFLATADEKQKIQYVVAFDRANGKQLWQVEINRGAFPKKNHLKNTEATPTVASDGERLFVTFYHHDKVELAALDLNGKEIWKKPVQPFDPKMYEYGYAPSPLIYRNSVIISAEYDGASAITAFDRKDGSVLWKAPRPTMITFSTPVVGHVAGRDQLLISGADKVWSYDPIDGKPLWSTKGTTLATCGTLVWEGDTVFASGGYPGSETLAVKADGTGTVLWRNKEKCYEESMLAYQGYLYALTGKGILFCWRGIDGKQMWAERLEGPISASPVLAGGNVYWANEAGKLYVFKPNPERFELVAENQVGDDAFPSPAICGGQIFLRVGQRTGNQRQEMLYCFANRK